MLLNDDVVADGEAKASAFSGGFRREERIEYLLFHFRRNTGAVVANADFHAIAKAFGRGSEGWHIVASIRFRLALGRSIEAVRDQIQKRPRDVLREDISLACRWIKGAFEGDVEALFFGPRPVPGEIEALLNQRIDIDGPVFARAFARVQQHVPDDGIGTLAVLHNLVEVAPECVHQFGNLTALLFSDVQIRERLSQLINHLRQVYAPRALQAAHGRTQSRVRPRLEYF